VYFGARNPSKAQAVQKELEASTGRKIFEIAILDVTDLGSVRAAVTSLPEPVEALVMNAGGTGGKSPAAITKDGATQIFATNVRGHVALLNALIEQRKLSQAAVLTGSEAARGVPQLQMKRPAFQTTSVGAQVTPESTRHCTLVRLSGGDASGIGCRSDGGEADGGASVPRGCSSRYL
jgi:NAD(P)-dependent dehydrogenase (short-subunit alcohol dehydrogenase family)